MKYIIFLLFSLTLFAQDAIEISAQNFSADEKIGISSFSGDVKVTRGDDLLKSRELKVYFDTEKKPLKYEAIGNVFMEITIEGKKYQGEAKKALYDAKNNSYLLEGDAHIKELGSSNLVVGEKISVDRKNGKISVVGKSNEPVKFIFTIDEE